MRGARLQHPCAGDEERTGPGEETPRPQNVNPTAELMTGVTGRSEFRGFGESPHGSFVVHFVDFSLTWESTLTMGLNENMLIMFMVWFVSKPCLI